MSRIPPAVRWAAPPAVSIPPATSRVERAASAALSAYREAAWAASFIPPDASRAALSIWPMARAASRTPD